ncbi:hypothetical protein NL445_29735, partial [Klebsiella pneumoniae]|nr:hypothetical protein [Klebsiella pneumoniae]
ASDKFKIQQMVGVHVASGIDLEAVVVLVRVLEQTVHGIQNFVRQKEKPLSTDSTVVQPFLSTEYYVKPSAEFVSR